MIENKKSFEQGNEIKENNSINEKIKAGEDKILQNISKEYGIQNSNLEKLTKFKTSKGIEGLKEEINNQKIDSLKEISDSKLENILDAITKYQKEIKQDAKEQLAELKNNTNNIGKNNKSFIISKLSKDSQEKYINNPKSITDNIIGGTLGLMVTGEKILQTTFDLGKGLVFLPKDLYEIATKKAKYDKEI